MDNTELYSTPLNNSFSPTPNSNKPNYLIIFLIIFQIITLGFVIYIGFQFMQISNKISNQTDSTSPSAISLSQPLPTNSTLNVHNSWTTYDIQKFNLQFQLPSNFALNDFPSGKEIFGETGSKYCLTFSLNETSWFAPKPVYAGGAGCGTDLFTIAATSTDFSAGREGMFEDNISYTVNNGKFLINFPNNQQFEIKSDRVTAITNSHNIQVLKIIGKDEISTDPNAGRPTYRSPGTPSEGYIGAMINSSIQNNYPGLIIEMKLDDQHTEDLFDEILSTFKSTN